MRKFIAFLLVFTMTLSVGFSFGANVEDLQKQIEEKEANVAEKEQELEQIEAEAGSVEQQYWNAVAEVEVLQERIAETTEEIDLKDKAIIKTRAEVDEATEEYNFQADEFGGRLRKMYLTKDDSFWSMIFSAEGFEDLLMRISNYQRIVKMDEKTMDELSEQKIALEKLEKQLSDEMGELQVLKEQQEVDKVLLDQKAVELEKRKAELEAMAAEISAQISAETAAGAEIQAQMGYLIEQARQHREAEAAARRAAEEAAAAEQEQEQGQENGDNQTPNDSTGPSSSTDEPSRGDYVGGSWQWPTPGYYYVSYGFGNRVHPVYGTSDYHNGIDILGDAGASIVAARDGLVVYAGWYSGYGNTVIIDHGDGMQSLYAHGSGVGTSTGNYVYAGNYIMPMGSTGISSANHLHFGVMSGGSWVNPSAYVGG